MADDDQVAPGHLVAQGDRGGLDPARRRQHGQFGNPGIDLAMKPPAPEIGAVLGDRHGRVGRVGEDRDQREVEAGEVRGAPGAPMGAPDMRGEGEPVGLGDVERDFPEAGQAAEVLVPQLAAEPLVLQQEQPVPAPRQIAVAEHVGRRRQRAPQPVRNQLDVVLVGDEGRGGELVLEKAQALLGEDVDVWVVPAPEGEEGETDLMLHHPPVHHRFAEKGVDLVGEAEDVTLVPVLEYLGDNPVRH
ncbi:hypothetical protein ACFSKM_16675 [Ancylobacter dichloromethanicus]